MYLYHWDKETREFLGVSPARIDPLESCKKNETVYLQGSPFTTLVQVPYFEKNEIPVWDGEKWIVKKDYRGEVIYNIKTSESFIVSGIGEIPEGYTKEKPTKNSEWVAGKWEISLKKTINEKLLELKTFRNKKENEDVSFGQIKISIDRENWLELYRKKLWVDNHEPVSNIPWKIDNDVWIELSAKDIQEIFNAIESNNLNCDLNEFKHSKIIQELKTVEEVANYDFKKEW